MPWGAVGLQWAQCLCPATNPSTALEVPTSPAPQMAGRGLGWPGTSPGQSALKTWGCSALTAHLAPYCEWLMWPSLRAASGEQRINHVPWPSPRTAAPAWGHHRPCPQRQARGCLATQTCLATNCLTALAGGSQLECPDGPSQAAGAILSLSAGRCDGPQAVPGP